MTDASEIWDNRPASPVRDTPIEIQVVGKRCIYINNYRAAGGKPYYSENLLSFEHRTTLGEVLDSFSDAQIKAAVSEKKARQKYFLKHHEKQKAAEEKRRLAEKDALMNGDTPGDE